MQHEQITLGERTADGYTISLGSCNLVFIKQGESLLACGAIDILALDKFKIPAVKVTGVATCDDLLKGEVKAVNEHAAALGATPGMTGREALERL